MGLLNCGAHGIKLSTFVNGVAIRSTTIIGAKASGVMAVSSNTLAVEDCSIQVRIRAALFMALSDWWNGFREYMFMHQICGLGQLNRRGHSW